MEQGTRHCPLGRTSQQCCTAATGTPPHPTRPAGGWAVSCSALRCPHLHHVRPPGAAHPLRRPQLQEAPLGGGQQRLNGNKHLLRHPAPRCIGGEGAQGERGGRWGPVRGQRLNANKHPAEHPQLCCMHEDDSRRPCLARMPLLRLIITRKCMPKVHSGNCKPTPSPCQAVKSWLTRLPSQAVKGHVWVALVPQLNVLALACTAAAQHGSREGSWMVGWCGEGSGGMHAGPGSRNGRRNNWREQGG